MPSPPKPWENKNINTNNTNFNTGSTSSLLNSSSTPFPPTDNSASNQPPVPSRPNMNSSSNMNLNSSTNSYGIGNSSTNSYGMGNSSYNSGYGSSYGSGYGSSYGSGYGSSYGGYGSMYGSGYSSGYGSMYGGGYGSGYGSMYGSSYGGLGGYGMNRYSPYNRYGMNGRMGPGEDPSFSQQMQLSTQSTFQLLERVVGTFGGIAQMLESTFFATQSSFMAMVGVAEHFGMLKSSVSQIFSLYAIFRAIRNTLYRLVGKRPPIDSKEINVKEFKKFSDKPKYSFKPFLMFLGLVFGVPYLLHLFMKSMARRMVKQQQERLKAQGIGMNPNDTPQTFEFAKAMYDFKGQNSNELNFVKGDLIAILSKVGSSSASTPQWWQGRMRDGKVGMFPSNYVEILEKKFDVSNNNPQLNQNSIMPITNNINNLPSQTSSQIPLSTPFSTPFQGTFGPPPPIV